MRDEELRRKDIIMQMAQANASLAARVPELRTRPGRPKRPPDARRRGREGSRGRAGPRREGNGSGCRSGWWRRLLWSE